MPKRKTTKDFIQRAISKHGKQYDYSKTNYVHSGEKVTITCPEHGDFSQLPHNHLNGHGCPKCGRGYNDEIFREKATKAHNGRYLYPNPGYTGSANRVHILCPHHGEFTQRADRHLSGKAGCQYCCAKDPVPPFPKTKAEFIEQAEEVCGKKFNYTHTSFKEIGDEVEIECPKHGPFVVVAWEHILGLKTGCEECDKERNPHHGGFKPGISGTLYFLKFEKPQAEFWKIGITNHTLELRLGSELGFVVEKYTWDFPIGEDACKVERLVLNEFRGYRFRAQDHSLKLMSSTIRGDTECFVKTLPYKKVIQFIDNHAKK